MPHSTENLLKGLVKTIFVQHQDFIPPNDLTAWIRRFALGYSLQIDFHIFSEEEWERITQVDLPNFFKGHRNSVSIWQDHMRKYYPDDTQRFIDEIIEKTKVGD